MGLGSSRARDQDMVLCLDGCFHGLSPKCMAFTNTTGNTGWENRLKPETTNYPPALNSWEQFYQILFKSQSAGHRGRVSQWTGAHLCICLFNSPGHPKPQTTDSLRPVITLRCMIPCAPRMKTSHCTKKSSHYTLWLKPLLHEVSSQSTVNES